MTHPPEYSHMTMIPPNQYYLTCCESLFFPSPANLSFRAHYSCLLVSSAPLAKSAHSSDFPPQAMFGVV